MAKYENKAGRVIEVPDGSVADDRMSKDTDRYTPVSTPKPKRAAKKAPKAKVEAEE
jgi:hypothetical protein